MCSDNFLFLPKTSQIFCEKVQVLVASLSLAPTHQLMATQASILAPLTIDIEGYHGLRPDLSLPLPSSTFPPQLWKESSVISTPLPSQVV